MKETLENIGIPLKTVVVIIMAVITYGVSLATVYFTMKSKVDTATEIASETKDRLNKFNPDVIVYQVQELKEQVKESNSKADAILTLLRSK